MLSSHAHACPRTFAIMCVPLRGFPIKLPEVKWDEVAPWSQKLSTVSCPKLIHLAGNGQSLPVIGAVTALIFSDLHFESPPVRLHV